MRLDDALEGGTLVGTIAKGLALGKATAAKADFGAATEAVGVAFLIHNFYFAVNEQRAVVHHGHLNFCHSILRSKPVYPIVAAMRARM
jgi:hypothetical protein